MQSAFLFIALPSSAQSNTPTNDALLNEAGHALQQRKTDQVLYDVTDADRAYVNPVRTTKYEWALRNGQLYQRRQDVGGQWHKSVYNGKTEQEVTYGRGQKAEGSIDEIQNAKTDLRLLHSANMYEGAYRMDSIWISDLLAAGNFSAKQGPVTQPFGRTVRVTGIGPQVNLGYGPVKRSYQLLLAPERSWMCIQATVDYPGEDKSLFHDEYAVSKAELRNEVWLPTELRKAEYTKDGSEPRELFVEHTLHGTIVKQGNLPSDLFAFAPLLEKTHVLDLDNLRRYKIQNGQMVSTDNKFTRTNALIWAFVLSTGAFVAGGLLLASKFLRRRNAAG